LTPILMLKAFWQQHSTLFKTKQYVHRTAVILERAYCKSWCCTCFKTKTTYAFASSMESTVGSC
jgi:hypothetical protein